MESLIPPLLKERRGGWVVGGQIGVLVDDQGEAAGHLGLQVGKDFEPVIEALVRDEGVVEVGPEALRELTELFPLRAAVGHVVDRGLLLDPVVEEERLADSTLAREDDEL